MDWFQKLEHQLWEVGGTRAQSLVALRALAEIQRWVKQKDHQRDMPYGRAEEIRQEAESIADYAQESMDHEGDAEE